MRFVNADALIQVQMYDEEHEEWSVETMTVEECLARFADVPPIIEMDRPHGKWKRRLVDNGFNADWVCSECGYRVKTDFVNFNFCPNCGARMKGADDE